MFRGTVSVILTEPRCKDAMSNLQWCPLKLCLNKYELDLNLNNVQNCLVSIGVYLKKWLAHSAWKHSGIKTFKPRETTISSTFLIR